MLQKVITKLFSSFLFPNKAGELQPPTRILEFSRGRFARLLRLEVNTREGLSLTKGVTKGRLTKGCRKGMWIQSTEDKCKDKA